MSVSLGMQFPNWMHLPLGGQSEDGLIGDELIAKFAPCMWFIAKPIPRFPRRRAFAPTGQDPIAQGVALGSMSNNCHSPNGARFDGRFESQVGDRIHGDRSIRWNGLMRFNAGFESRPVGANSLEPTVTQGYALGYRIRPLGGQDRIQDWIHEDSAISVGSLGRAYELFGDKLPVLLDELNARLAA